MTKIIFFQPYIQKWRYDFLKVFTKKFSDKYDVKALYGKNISSNGKQRNHNNMEDINHKAIYSLPFSFKFRGQNYPIYYSPFLFFELIRSKPDVIVTEGEINILNNIQIELYCKIFKKEFLWWSLGKVRNRKTNVINAFTKPIIKYYLNKSKYILARNTLAKKYYMKEHLIDEDKIILVPNSMDHHVVLEEIELVKDQAKQLSESLNGKKILLFSGALIKDKKLDDLLYAVKIIKEKGVNIFCIIVGDGPEKSELENLTLEYKLKNDVLFTGAVYEGVSKYFIVSDVVVLPGMGGHLIHHGMIHNKPIITRVADGVEEDLVIDGYNGYILRDFDNSNLIDAILNVILDHAKNLKMGENSGKIVKERWNIDFMATQMDKAIEGKG